MPERVSGALRRLGRNEFLRHGALVFVAQNTVNVLSFVFHVAISRRIGVTNYGALNALLAGMTVLLVPSVICTTVVVKYAAEFRALGDRAKLRTLVDRIASVLGGVALAVGILGWIAARPVGDFLHVADAGAVIVTVAILALSLVLPVMRGVLQGTEDFRAYAISAVLEAVVKVALALALTGAGWGLLGALLGWLGGALVSLAYTYLTLRARYRSTESAALGFDLARLIRTSGGVTLATLAVSSLGFSDVVMVKHYFDGETAGLYSVAALAGKMLFWLVAFVPAVVLPRAAHLIAAGRSPAGVLLQALGMVAVLSGTGLVVYAFVPGVIVTVLAGSAFLPAAGLVFPYGVATTLLAALNTVVAYNLGIHRFAFVAPLGVVAVAEVVVFALRHDTPLQIIGTLVVANACALVASLMPGKLRSNPGRAVSGATT